MGREFALIRGSSATGKMGSGREVKVQHAGDELAQRDAQMAPKPALQTCVILRSGEKISHELPENGAAPQKLHHARGHRGAQERAAIEATHDARGKFQLRRKRRLHARWRKAARRNTRRAWRKK